ncbi:uncharacterized protein LOC113552331 [Rhopalosiphum maidis]|uniref:uncharacterized protein LOC113552331 n=1 Tax=Rhopalosiphum maidis TaxID=43146 RepID=UPI000F00F469|nr:uncharacterized protein LOC113552331 [Rhopalosiphum maidis]
MTSSDGGLQSCRRQDNRGGGGGVGQNLPIIMATGCRMPRSPSRDKDLASCAASRTAAAHQQPYATTAVVLNRVTSSYPEAFFKRMSQDITNSVWFEEENDLIKSCGALQSALGLSKSFSTGDIADATNMDTGCWLADNDDVRMPHSASELAINKLRINSDVLLMATTMQGRLGNTSRSLSTCVVVGDMASTSQLPSPSRYSSSLHNSYAPSTFSPTDLVRSVNKKVRQNYIQRRLLITYKTLERLSLSEFNLDKSAGADRVPEPLQLSDRHDVTATTTAAGSSKYLSVPKTGGKPLCPDDIAVCTDTIKRYQPKAFTRYDRNMFIVNWLDNIDPQNNTTEDQ